MSKSVNNGGAAFPRQADGYYTGREGMSLRDWFAGQALVGITLDPTRNTAFESPADAAKAAYDVADHMISARGE